MAQMSLGRARTVGACVVWMPGVAMAIVIPGIDAPESGTLALLGLGLLGIGLKKRRAN